MLTVYDKILKLGEHKQGVPVVVTLNKSPNAGEVSYGIKTFDDIFKNDPAVADTFKKKELTPVSNFHVPEALYQNTPDICGLINVLCYDPKGSNYPQDDNCLVGGGFHYRKFKLIGDDDDKTEAMTIKPNDMFDIERKIRKVFITNEFGVEMFFALNRNDAADPDLADVYDYSYIEDRAQFGLPLRSAYVHTEETEFVDGFVYYVNEEISHHVVSPHSVYVFQAAMKKKNEKLLIIK